MGISRQHLTALLSELAGPALSLIRWKPNGKFAPWLFRFNGPEEEELQPDVVSATGDTSLSRESKNKTIFAGRIEIDAETNVNHTPWADLIRTAKSSLSCWNVDTQAIWDRFLLSTRRAETSPCRQGSCFASCASGERQGQPKNRYLTASANPFPAVRNKP